MPNCILGIISFSSVLCSSSSVSDALSSKSNSSLISLIFFSSTCETSSLFLRSLFTAEILSVASLSCFCLLSSSSLSAYSLANFSLPAADSPMILSIRPYSFFNNYSFIKSFLNHISTCSYNFRIFLIVGAVS